MKQWLLLQNNEGDGSFPPPLFITPERDAVRHIPGEFALQTEVHHARTVRLEVRLNPPRVARPGVHPSVVKDRVFG